MALLFFYLPFLVVIPFLFIAGIFLFVIPGGFIVLFIGAYSVVVAIAQLVAVAVDPYVNSADHEGERCVRELSTPPPRQLSLL